MDATALYRAEKERRRRGVSLDRSKAALSEAELRKRADQLFGAPPKRRRTADPAETARWTALYQAGHSLRQIGRLEQTNWDRVYKRLVKAGVAMREAPVRKGLSTRALEQLDAQGQILAQILRRLTALEQALQPPPAGPESR